MFRITHQYLLKLTCILIFAFSLIAKASPAFTLRGTVTDPSGAVVVNARVELLEHGVPVANVVTNGQGRYSIFRKPEPESRLRITASGFEPLEKSLGTKNSTENLTEDIVLQLATLSEQVTVTATGNPTPLSQLGATVTLLDSSEYQGTRDIQQGLRLISGMQTTQVGQAGGSTSLYIRGGYSDANKVLIDGIPMNDIGGNVEFANIASAGIEQVEVLRGPNSVLYGSDALAGVVRLTTARGTTPLPLFTYQAGGGNFGTYHQEGSIGGEFHASTISPPTPASIATIPLQIASITTERLLGTTDGSYRPTPACAPRFTMIRLPPGLLVQFNCSE